MTSRIPHLLEPYLGLPDETALVVLTSVLGASTNWLVCRHLYSLLKYPSSHKPPSLSSRSPGPQPRAAAHGGEDAEGEGDGREKEVAVLLVSFLRDFAFWRESLARLGLDLEAAARRGGFGYVDGLGALFSHGSPSQPPPQPQSQSRFTGQGQQQQQQEGVGMGVGSEVRWKRVLTSAAPADMRRVILEGVEQLRLKERNVKSPNGETKLSERRVVLVVDGLDFVLAASEPGRTGEGPSSSGTAMALKETLMDLRENTHAAIVTLAADDPFIKEQETTLEKQHAWFALSLAHEADTVLGLRLLDTGAAKDVSGVIRITHGGTKSRAKDHEYLYHVGGDGGVKVFERGQ